MANHLVVPDGALSSMLTPVVNAYFWYGANGTWTWQLHLYNSNITPSHSDTNSTYSSSEATFPGYSAITVNLSDWSSVTTVGSVAKTTTSQYTFTCTGSASETIYGYWLEIYNGITHNLQWAQLFDVPISITTTGDVVQFSLEYDMSSKY